MFVITGGGTGIGRALALTLAKKGLPVLIIGRRESLLREVAGLNSCIEYLCADVSLPEGREVIIKKLQHVSAIHGLVHNAGTIKPIKSIGSITLSEWRKVMETNVEAPLFLTQCLSEKLQGNRVLNISSGAAYFPVKGWSAYCTSKAALSMLTQCFQLEVKDIHFASVMPGIIDTPMQSEIRKSEQMDSEKLDFFKQLKTNNALVSPETAACFLSWLLLEIEPQKYTSKEWDIYDVSHHAQWLKPPHQVPVIA